MKTIDISKIEWNYYDLERNFDSNKPISALILASTEKNKTNQSLPERFMLFWKHA